MKRSDSKHDIAASIRQPAIDSIAGRIIYAAVALLLAVGLVGVSLLNGMTWDGEKPGEITYHERFAHYIDEDQYARLADALIHGSLSLDLPVSDELAQLENPYDYGARYEASDGGANPIFWDHAFYEGKYYCYFGVVSAVLVFAPYQLITGQWLDTSAAVVALGVATVGAMALLCYRIARRFFGSSVTLATLIATLIFLFAGSNVVYLVFVARFYSVPILSSLALTFLGLWFWLGARKEAQDGSLAPRRDDASGKEPSGLSSHADRTISTHMSPKRAGSARSTTRLSAWHLAAGSLCMALNLGCRPQFVLACFLAIPLFWNEIRHERLLFSRRGAKETAAALIPFALAFAPLLWYNWARFGSVLDFGSSYNLTGFDMTQYHQRLLLTPVLLFYYLLQPINPSFTFPFVEATEMSRPVGWTPMEPMFGGYFWLVPMALLVFLLPAVRRELKERGLWGPALCMLAFAAVVLIVDTRTAGVTQRYFGDFGWYIVLAAAFVMLALQAQTDELVERVRHLSGRIYLNVAPLGVRHRKAIAAFMACALIFAFAVGALSLFSPERYDSIAALNPTLWEVIVRAVG